VSTCSTPRRGYGFGTAERLLGEALRLRVHREEVVIATKGGLRMEGGNLLRDASADWIRAGVEMSLRNLGTDYIDLYQVHCARRERARRRDRRRAEQAGSRGRGRHVGVSNYGVEDMEELRRFGPLETLQPPYHLFRRAIEDEILPYTAKHDIGVLAYGPLAHGLLSGRMTSDATFAAHDWRSKSSDFTGETFRHNLQVVERLRQFGRVRGIGLPELVCCDWWRRGVGGARRVVPAVG
jgi:aryl-alcohol dehydrogenase-like predicted oxidoreductase